MRLQELIETCRERGLSSIPGERIVDLYQTHGLPLELTVDVAEEQGFLVEREEIEVELQRHQDISRAGSQFGGGVFVAETVSVVLQTSVFKYRLRRFGRAHAEQHRVFRMAPLHHHFEQLGWHESTVVTRFYILGIICALVALATLKIR